jgi:hypothetical protein
MIQASRPSRPRRAWWALGVLLFIAPVCGQEKGKEVELRFAAQAAPAELGKLVMVAGEIRSTPFELPVNHLSEAQAAPARVVTLERETKPGALARIQLPEEGDAFIVLLIPGVKSTFDPVVLPAKSDTFRPGDFYAYNASKKPVMGQVGTSSFGLRSREGQVVRPAGAREGRFYDVLLGVREDSKNRVISTSRWPVSTTMRTYVFFFDNPKRGDIDFRAIDEFVPADE